MKEVSQCLGLLAMGAVAVHVGYVVVARRVDGFGEVSLVVGVVAAVAAAAAVSIEWLLA